MNHLPRILLVGAGYAARAFAGRLAARRVPVDLTVIAPEARLHERVRLHEALAGRAVRSWSRAGLFPADCRHRQGTVERIDAAAGRAHTSVGEIEFDHVVVAAGSTDALARHALRATGGAAGRPSWHVVGAGTTGIEVATELAGAGASVTWWSRRLAPGLPAAARQAIIAHADRAGIELRDEAELPDAAELSGQSVVWCTGFDSTSIDIDSNAARRAGRWCVDPWLQLPDRPNVQVIGDAAYVGMGPERTPLRRSCAAAIPMGCHAADVLADTLRARPARPFSFRFTGSCISLGRRDGLVLLGDGPSARLVARGRTAAAIKEAVVRSTIAIPRFEARWRVPCYRWPVARDWPAPRATPQGLR